MPRQLIADRVAVESLHFVLDGAGQVSGLKVTCSVNYGSVGLREVVDLWGVLNASQRTAVQNLYNAVVAQLAQAYLG